MVEALEDWLFDAGAVAVTLEDAADQPLLEPGPGETPLWDDITLVALFPEAQPLATVLEAVPETLLADPERAVTHVADRDWERAWMDDFHPLQMGERLWVCPSWTSPPDPDAVNLILDPGLAFGSGTHPTTAMCLGALDRAVLPGMSVVDYGCGSGILAIAALKLGAAAALGIDNDPQAITASDDNARRNDIPESSFEVVMPEAASLVDWAGRADIVVANILANPLIELAPKILAMLKPGGQLLLAGLLADQVASVVAAYEYRLPLKVQEQQGDWVLLGGTSPEIATP
jgi:ribosomal protein L11 methyltransferase